MQEYDKSSKWLISRHGDSILRLAGIDDVVSWRALPAEVVQPRQLPDGMIEAVRAGRPEPCLFILELATYPEERLREQALRDMLLVYLERRELPEVLALVLHPKGQLRHVNQAERRSPLDWSGLSARWRTIELWDLPAEGLLATNDVGMIPWVPLCRFDGPPEPIFRECRARIDRLAAPDEHENLLAVTQVLAGLRYNSESLMTLLGGRNAMIESPVLQQLKAEWTEEAAAEATVKATTRAAAKSILTFLRGRFGTLPDSLRVEINAIDDERILDELVEGTAKCADLQSFCQLLTAANRTRAGETP